MHGSSGFMHDIRFVSARLDVWPQLELELMLVSRSLPLPLRVSYNALANQSHAAISAIGTQGTKKMSGVRFAALELQSAPRRLRSTQAVLHLSSRVDVDGCRVCALDYLKRIDANWRRHTVTVTDFRLREDRLFALKQLATMASTNKMTDKVEKTSEGRQVSLMVIW